MTTETLQPADHEHIEEHNELTIEQLTVFILKGCLPEPEGTKYAHTLDMD